MRRRGLGQHGLEWNGALATSVTGKCRSVSAGGITCHDGAGHGRQRGPGPTGFAAQDVEGLVDVKALALGEHPLGLLDDDPAVQGLLQLLVQVDAALRRPLWRIAIVAMSASP